MKQIILDSYAGEHGQLIRATAGAAQYGAILELTKFTEAVLRAKTTTLDAAEKAYREARDAQTSAQRELDRASAQSKVVIPRVVAALSLTFGDHFNPSWQQIGLVDSLAVPTTHDGRVAVLLKSADYFKGHPGAAIPNQGITEAALAGLESAYSDALVNVQSCETATSDARVLFDAKMEEGQAALRGLIKELTLCLSPTDVRWKGFGFNIPGYPAVPEAVTNLVVTPGAPGSVGVRWDPSIRSERFLVEVQSGEDPEFYRVVTVYEPRAELTELTPGAAVQVRVVAANEGGESVPSEPVSVIVPALALAA